MTERPLRIAVSSYYLPSESKIGAGYMAHRLANALAELGHRITMISPCLRPEDARYEHDRVHLAGRCRTTVRWPLALRRYDWSRFDALIAQGDDHLLTRSNRPPVHIRTLHGSCFDEAMHVPGKREKARMFALGVSEAIAAVRTPIVVGVSRSSLRWYPWLSIVIPNGVDTTLFHAGTTQIRERNPTILFVGTYRNRKRGALLQQQFQEVVRRALPDSQLWMVCTDAPEAPGVTVLGRIGDQELASLYRRAWVFCLPSSYEGFGVPYVEALVSGLPVVATRNRGALEVLDNGHLGVITDERHLGDELVNLLLDSARRGRMTDLARHAPSRYSVAACAERYAAIVSANLASYGVCQPPNKIENRPTEVDPV